MTLLRHKFTYMNYIIIDEYSLLSQATLGKIKKRLKQIKENENNFGGISVILVGDPAQLPTSFKHWI